MNWWKSWISWTRCLFFLVLVLRKNRSSSFLLDEEEAGAPGGGGQEERQEQPGNRSACSKISYWYSHMPLSKIQNESILISHRVSQQHSWSYCLTWIASLLERVDLNKKLEHLDVHELIEGADLGAIVARSAVGALEPIVDGNSRGFVRLLCWSPW